MGSQNSPPLLGRVPRLYSLPIALGSLFVVFAANDARFLFFLTRLHVRANCAAINVRLLIQCGGLGGTYDACHCIAATVVMCAACAGQDQQSDGVGAPKATPAGMVDKLNQEINAVLAGPKPIAAAEVTDANAVGDPRPVPDTLCARIAAAATNFEPQCKPE